MIGSLADRILSDELLEATGGGNISVQEGKPCGDKHPMH